MFNIQFDFDPEMSEITNLRVVKVGEQVDDAIVTLEDNKLKLSKSAQLLLGVIPNDRITVSYYTVNPEETFPVIGKSELFTDSTGGNRLTKSNTVSFRGTQRDILLEYGKSFKLEPFKSFFKMVKLEEMSDNDDLSDEELDLENLK